MRNTIGEAGNRVGRATAPSMDEVCTRLEIRPLTTRSLILSALLGSHPPRLPSSALVALAELFHIRPGTTRTALSRLVAQGELESDAGSYRLAGRLLTRQREQDSGRLLPDTNWQGEWVTVVVTAERRTMAERRAFRASMAGARMGELRPDVWMRPANLAAVERLDNTVVTTGPIDAEDPGELVARLWPLDDLHRRAQALIDEMQRRLPEIDDPGVLPVNFVVSAATVRFLRSEPQLPPELWPDSWAPPDVRNSYDEFERAFQQRLRAFFAEVG